jgi:hypothetical protein
VYVVIFLLGNGVAKWVFFCFDLVMWLKSHKLCYIIGFFKKKCLCSCHVDGQLYMLVN